MRGICFDFNGVIVDDERHHCLAVISTLAEYGIMLDRAGYYRDYLGFDDEGCFRHAWAGARLQLSDALLGDLVAQKGERYRALLDADLTLVPGIQPFVHALTAAGIRLVVVSAARRWEIDHVLAIAGLSHAFAGIVSAEDVSRTKPDPEGYLRGLAVLDLPASQCVVIEDSLPGLRAGRSAGMRVAMLTTSHSHGTLAAQLPDLIWDDYTDRTPEELPWNRSSS
ncbi:MAG: HAD family phosphatase [Gemmatimonadota bacterium]